MKSRMCHRSGFAVLFQWRIGALLCLAAVAATAAAAEPPMFEGAWIRATPPMATTAAAYITIHGTGEGDRLIGASSELAETVEIHTTTEQNGLMQMKEIPAIAIPAQGDVALSPGGEHLMLIGLKRSPKPGETFVITLQFERAGSVDVTFPVIDARTGNSRQDHLRENARQSSLNTRQ